MSDSTPQLPLGAKSGKGKKSKSSVYFSPVNLNIRSASETISNIEVIVKEITGECKPLIHDFIHSGSTDNQITIMKKLIELLKSNVHENVVNFIVIVLFESEPRHPVKCLLMRHLEKWTDIHEMFIKLLSNQIMSYCHSNKEYNYEENNIIISRLGSCLENFSLGFQAVKFIENEVLKLLLQTLKGSLYKLKSQLSPEEKLNVSKCMHQTLRLTLLVYQKATVDKSLSDSVRNVIVKLIECPDVTMDNRCLCAILDIAVLKGEDMNPWDTFGKYSDVLSNAKLWCTNKTNLLCFYYALFTAAPTNVIDLLDNDYSSEAKQMFYDIVQKVVDITDRMSDSIDVTMAGARTVAIVASRLAAASGETGSNEPGSNEPGSNEAGINDLGPNEALSDEPESKKLRLKEQESTDSGSKKQGSNDQESRESGSNECKNKSTRFASLRVCLLVEVSVTSLSAHVSAAPRQLAAQAQLDLLHYYLHHHPEEGRRWLSGAGLGAEGLCRLRRAAGAGRGRGAAALRDIAAPADLLPALTRTDTMLQASSLLSTYISLECGSVPAELVHRRWVEPALALLLARPRLDPDTTDHLVALLATALDRNDDLLDYILPLIKRPEAIDPDNIKCTLLLMHVILKSKVGKKYQDTEDKWKGTIAFDVLGKGMSHQDDQVVSMTLTAGLLGGVSGGVRTLWYLLRTHAHRPLATHTRTLDHIAHFLKRVESEYHTAKRKNPNNEGDKGESCPELLERLRTLCFDNLLPGGNHYRRGISLFILQHIHGLQLGYDWSWMQPQVDTILRHIDDTYDTNRHTAYHILRMCPLHLLKDGMTSIGITSVEQIVSTCGARARDASGAALRVEILLHTAGALPRQPPTAGAPYSQLLTEQAGAVDRQLEVKQATSEELDKLPITDQEEALDSKQQTEQVGAEVKQPEVKQATSEALDRQPMAEQERALDSKQLTEQAGVVDRQPEVTTEVIDRQQIPEQEEALDRQQVAEKCLELAKRRPWRAPALHVLQQQLTHLSLSSSIWSPAEELALKVLDLAAPLVEAASPEGYVPDLFFDTPVEPHPESKYLFTVGEEVMTSQTMLLYAWTSAKEAWSILCEVCVRGAGLHRLLLPLSVRLLRVRHRALLDHAAAQHAAVLQHYYTRTHTHTRESEEISEVLKEIGVRVREEILSQGDGTRRGAGLTALTVALAGISDAWCRALAHDVVDGIRRKCITAPHIGAALLRAKKLHRGIHRELQHFMVAAFEQLHDTNTEMQWSCAAVISAGVRRALGPSGPGGAPGPTLRTTVFVSRYPLLYSRIVEYVCNASEASYLTRASLACALLVLGRVGGEGAHAHAQLWAGLEAATRSPADHIRRMAATAAASTLPHNKYLEHATEVLSRISEPKIMRNLCHGLILRLIAMIESGSELEWSEIFAARLTGSLWIMESACYPLIHEYINLAMLLRERHPDALVPEYRTALGAACGRLARGGAGAGPGRALCAGAGVGAAHALLPPHLAATVLDAALRSDIYEVCQSALKCYLSVPPPSGVIDPATEVIDPTQLCVVYTSHPHPECRRLALQLLVQRGLLLHIIQEPPSNLNKSDVYNWRLVKLYEKWENAVENERSLFIEGIRRTLSEARESEETEDEDTQGEATEVAQEEDTQGEVTEAPLGEQAGRAVATAMFDSSALTASEEEQDAAAALVEDHAEFLLDVCDDEDDLAVPLCVFGAYARLAESGRVRNPLVRRDALVGRVRNCPAVLLALALLDFAVPLQEPDETSQYRAFERSWDPEVAEEGLWTARCGQLLRLPAALAAVGRHAAALRRVCGRHYTHFVQRVQHPHAHHTHVHPKVLYLVNKLREIVVQIPNNAN